MRYWLIIYIANTKHSKYKSKNEINFNTCPSHVKHEANIYRTWGIIIYNNTST